MASRQLDEEAIFHTARKIDNVDGRREYLDQICAGDRSLRQRVEALLEIHEQERAFLNSVSADPLPTAPAAPLLERPGVTIGRYRLMEQIGEGGMGVVFVADQLRPLQRKVALKVIKPGMDSQSVIARFEAERQALALMDHNSIARVFDAGTTDTGRPYFVMELVRGVPITEYCDQNKLTIRERLELFIQVCHAIQHAHQKGVIHRDIKPSNVLVTLHGDTPVPKVIDFGVAKALNTRLTDRTVYTEHFQVIGTLLYMSPEQAQLSGLDVDTRSDIYSLGVLLYELLTGTTPFRKEQLDREAFDQQRRIICEHEPQLASMRISSLGDTATPIAEHRRTDAGGLHQQLRGDLDWIVLKALEKDRTRRYESAASIAADIGRHLHDEPVVACPPSAGYRITKFVKRNKGPVCAAVLLAVSLLTGTVTATWLSVLLLRANQHLVTTIDQLEAALGNWQQELYRRALLAAFSGERDKVDAIVDQAQVAANGRAPAWAKKVHALVALFHGDVETARTILEPSVDIAPADAGAVALLAICYLESGAHDQYLTTRARLADLTSPAQLARLSAEDRLLVAQAQMFGDIGKGVQTVESVLASAPSALALAFHSQALMKQYYDDGKQETRDRALRELDAARLLMPDCAYVTVLELWANLPFISQGEHAAACGEKAKTAVDELAQYTTYPSARHGRACYFDSVGQVEDARREWKAIIESGASGYIQGYYAAFEYGQGNRQLAMDLLHKSVKDSVLSAIHYGEMLALEPGQESYADKTYTDTTSKLKALSIGPDDYIGVPETILLLVGDTEGAARQAAARATSGGQLPWQRAMLDFLATPDMSPETLLASATRTSDRVVAHKLIACRSLSRGEVELAEDHLTKCVQTFFWQPDAYWANAILSRLKTDAAWRDWLRTRHNKQ